MQMKKTSGQALKGLNGTKAYRQRIVTYITGRKRGATCDEVEARLDLKHQTASARIRELVLEGQLADSGITRLTRSGCAATVWVAT